MFFYYSFFLFYFIIGLHKFNYVIYFFSLPLSKWSDLLHATQGDSEALISFHFIENVYLI